MASLLLSRPQHSEVSVILSCLSDIRKYLNIIGIAMDQVATPYRCLLPFEESSPVS